jgi:nucleotide-binding universal stress UspA family protein
MRILVCVDGAASDRLLAAALPLAPATAVWVPVHVLDTRPRVDLGLLRAGIPGGGPLAPEHRAQIQAAGQEHARAVCQAAEALLRARGLATESALIRVGEPGRAICVAAAEAGADLVVLLASRRPGRPLTGPPSVGHTARFVVDHAPCPVLLIRGAVPHAT